MHNDDIALAIKSNPEKGFRALMARYREPVYWHIRRIVVSHNDAQDATQETFMRVFKAINKFRGECSFNSWIYRIATNEAIRIIESRKTVQLPIDSQDTELINIATEEYVDYSDLEAVKLQRAILSLPTKQQLAFNLRYYDELGYDEIAEIICSTADNVKANYHIAKKKIIEFMNSND